MMKIIKRDKLIEISVVSVLIIVAVVVGIKLYETTILEKHDEHIAVIVKSDVSVDNLEIEEHEAIEEENEFNITISRVEEVQLIETDENIVAVESHEINDVKDETADGKTIVIVTEEKPVVPEAPTVTNEEALTDSSKEPDYEEEPKVEDDKEVEDDDVVQVETETKDEKDIPAGVNTTPAKDSDNPFMKLGPPPSGDIEGVDASEISDHIPGTGDKF